MDGILLGLEQEHRHHSQKKKKQWPFMLRAFFWIGIELNEVQRVWASKSMHGGREGEGCDGADGLNWKDSSNCSN